MKKKLFPERNIFQQIPSFIEENIYTCVTEILLLCSEKECLGMSHKSMLAFPWKDINELWQ